MRKGHPDKVEFSIVNFWNLRFLFVPLHRKTIKAKTGKL